MLLVSGTVGASKGEPADLDGQMKKAYTAIQKTLAHFNTDLSHVVMERIYTTDIDSLIRSQPTRKQFYGETAPAATWVEVRRLYNQDDKIEIEVQVALECEAPLLEFLARSEGLSGQRSQSPTIAKPTQLWTTRAFPPLPERRTSPSNLNRGGNYANE